MTPEHFRLNEKIQDLRKQWKAETDPFKKRIIESMGKLLKSQLEGAYQVPTETVAPVESQLMLDVKETLLEPEVESAATRRAMTLEALRRAGDRGIHSYDITQVGGKRAAARIEELRKEGNNIISIPERRGKTTGCRYFLR